MAKHKPKMAGQTVLPKTGQITSYANFDDGYYQKGNPINPRFIDNGDGTVTDRATSLMWVKEPTRIIAGPSVIASNQIQVARGAWATGTLYAIADLVLAFTRAPGAITASRASNVVTASAPAFSPNDVGRQIFINGVSQGIVTLYTDETHVTVYGGGTTASNPLSVKSFFICIVSHNSGATFEDDWAANPTYWQETFWTDSVNNLTTQRTASWANAIANSEGLDYAGKTDWRLPNIRELMSIVDYSKYGPSIDTAVLPGTAATYYWSSTTAAHNSNYASSIDFNLGQIYIDQKPALHYIRPCRNL